MKSIKFCIGICFFYLIFLSIAIAETIEDHLKKASQLYGNKDFNGAIEEYQKLVDKLKKDKNLAGAQKVQMNIGAIFFEQEKYDQALKEYTTALELFKKPDTQFKLKLLTNIATTHYKLGNYALRASIIEKLLKENPKIDKDTKANLLCDLADSYRRNEIYSKAITNYKNALPSPIISSNPERQAIILTAIGLSHAKLGEFEDAVSNIERALEISKKINKPQSNAEIYSNLGIVYWDQGDYTKALENIAKAKEIETQNNLKDNLSADFNNEGLIIKSAGNYNKSLGLFEQSIKIAQEIKNARSEAIALSNRALVYRILGKNDEAMKEYETALKIYQSINSQEGIADCYLGLGKLYEIHFLDYQKAYEYYQKALDIYRKLGYISYQAETLNQIGSVLKKGINPQRTTRDLIFEDKDPLFIKINPEEAKNKSLESYQEALKLALKSGKKEAIWSAQQGIGYALHTKGELEEALKYYKDAINTVIKIRGSNSDSELMGDYLKDKDDLFTEAIELLSALYSKNKNQEYLRLQMEYQEIYKNEIMKNAMTTANMKYQDTNKAKLYEDIKKVMGQKDKIESLLARQQNTLLASTDTKDEQEQAKQETEASNKEMQKKASKLETTIKELIEKWKEEYKDDAQMFDTAEKVNFDNIQALLQPEEALISYFPTDESLNIICMTQKEIYQAQSPITNNDLTKLIVEEFYVKNIEDYARKIGELKKKKEEKNIYEDCISKLNKLYKYLIKPIEKQIENKSKIIIVPAKYLCYVPFSALVKTTNKLDDPDFLVHNKTISYMRLSYFFSDKYKKLSIPFNQNTIIAVGNPFHNKITTEDNSKILGLVKLDGTENEIKNLEEFSKKQNLNNSVFKNGVEANETFWKNEINKNQFSIMYFATHGVPSSETIYTIKRVKKSKQPPEYYKRFCDFVESQFIEKNPLDGYLLMGYSENGNDNGMLTLKEILSLDEKAFTKAEIAVLSACNTAVSFPSKVLKDENLSKELQKDFKSIKVELELKKLGLLPGVDQICLTDTFMKKFKYVIGTLWFAEDEPTQKILNEFFSNLVKLQPPEALRQAQIAYLKRNTYQYTSVPRHPYYWAVAGVFGK